MPSLAHTASVMTLALALPLGAAEGGSYTVRARAAAWYANLTNGEIANEDGDVLLTTDDLDLENGEVAPMIELGLKTPVALNYLPDVHLGLFHYSTDGDFDDILAEYDTEATLLDIYADATWGFGVLGYAGVGVGVAAHSLASEIEVDATWTSGGTSSGNIDDDVLTGGLALRGHLAPVDSFAILARAHICPWNDRTVYDGELNATYFPWEYLGIQLGYRLFQYEMEFEDDYLEGLLHGPYGGVAVQW